MLKEKPPKKLKDAKQSRVKPKPKENPIQKAAKPVLAQQKIPESAKEEKNTPKRAEVKTARKRSLDSKTKLPEEPIEKVAIKECTNTRERRKSLEQIMEKKCILFQCPFCHMKRFSQSEVVEHVKSKHAKMKNFKHPRQLKMKVSLRRIRDEHDISSDEAESILQPRVTRAKNKDLGRDGQNDILAEKLEETLRKSLDEEEEVKKDPKIAKAKVDQSPRKTVEYLDGWTIENIVYDSDSCDPNPFPNVGTKYTEGDVVWARMNGYPWWPCLVVTDPETQQFYDKITNQYQVVFLEEDKSLQRAWVKDVELFNESGDKKMFNKKHIRSFKSRVAKGVIIAERIKKWGRTQRLKLFEPQC